MKRRGLVLVLVLAALAVTPVGAAADRQPTERVVDRAAACERLASVAQALRARIGQIESTQERIRAKLGSGELNRRQEARAKQALRRLEALQNELERKLERILAVYEERCTT